jgi:hypothetical protein
MTQSTNAGAEGAAFYGQADIDTWYAANASKINKLGSLYIINGTAPGSTFVDVLTGQNGATRLEYNLSPSRIEDRKSLTDMGKEIIIGNYINSRILVLRRVQLYVDSTLGGGNVTGYVVSENNADDLQGNLGRFVVKVARV